MAVIEASFLRQRDYLAVGISHFFVDVLNNGRTVLVALLAISMGLTNAQVAIALLLYNVGSALLQPAFGWLADRYGPRWFVVGGVGLMMLFYGLGSLGNDWLALIATTIAGIGSGAFHPAGTMVASRASEMQKTRATAVFFMAGQFGLFLGPALAGILLEQYGRPGYLVLPLVSSIALISAWQWIRNEPYRRQPAPALVAPTAPRTRPDSFYQHAVLLGFIIMGVNTVSIASMNFAPKLFTELGYLPSYVGILSGLFMMGYAIGGVVGGTLADRIGGKPVIIASTIAAILPVYFYIPSEGVLRLLLLVLAGFFVGMPHSILVLMVQALFPGRQAMASGLALGFMFFSGAVGSYVIGVIADQKGLGVTLQATAVMLLGAAIITIFLPQKT